MENALQSTSRDSDLYEPTEQDEIETLYRIFILRRIGGIYPRQLPDYIQNHAITRFASDEYVKDFIAGLRASLLLTEVLRETSLAIPKDMDDLPEGTWDDIIRQMTAIITLWRRIDKALLGLARQHLTHESPNSADGMGVIKDSPFATALFDFMESLNLFPGNKFLQQIVEWFEATESLLNKIHKAIEKEERRKEKELSKEDELGEEWSGVEKKSVDSYTYHSGCTIHLEKKIWKDHVVGWNCNGILILIFIIIPI